MKGQKMKDKMFRTAVFSEDKKYRYRLLRQWDDKKTLVTFVGLNPSTANEYKDDPTIRRCIGFAKSWGYGGMWMVNLYSFVSTDPNKLFIENENIKLNNEFLLNSAKYSEKTIFAWGSFKNHKDRMEQVINMIPDAYCLGISKEGFPKHPLYLKSNLIPIKYALPHRKAVAE